MSFGVATLRAVVHADDKTSGDARSWYMISGDAKSWVTDKSQKDKNQAKGQNTSTGLDRVRKTEAEGVPIFYGPT
ncbi:hypothetical protein Tco_1205620 [Tanacetum coccineum]